MPSPSIRRVLIVKTSSMGDVVHALPAVSDMKRALPALSIDWLVEKPFAALPQQHSGVDRVIPLQWRKWRKSLRNPDTRQAIAAWRASMRAHRYDLILDMQGLLKSAAFACLAEGPRAGYDWRSAREPLASLFYQRRLSVSRSAHAVDRCRQLAAKALGYPLPDTAPDFGLTAPAETWHPPQRPFAVLIPCASRPEKLWPEQDWVTVGQTLLARGLAVVILWGSPEEQARAEALSRAIAPSVVPPFLTVAQVIGLLAAADIVVGLDTGMTHIAAATGRPTIGLYCDHEPGLAGVTGPGKVASLGGKGQVPSLSEVTALLDEWL